MNELLRLVTPHSSPLFALLLEESALPEHLRFAAEPLASDMRAALRRLEPADWSDTDKGLARQAEVRRIHREFRQALFDLLPPGTERTFIEAAGTEEWQGSIEVLMQLDNHPAIRAGVKPPPDAFISLRSAHVRFAPADGEYQLLAAGQENPVHTVRLKKDDPLGFGAQFGPGPIKAVAGQQFLDLPPDGQFYYWRKAP